MVLADVQMWVFDGLSIGAFALEVWAFADCVRHQAGVFPAAGKRTKGFWTAVTGVAMAFGFLSLPLGGARLNPIQFLPIVAVVAACVYLADVRPAVRQFRGGSGRGRYPNGGW